MPKEDGDHGLSNLEAREGGRGGGIRTALLFLMLLFLMFPFLMVLFFALLFFMLMNERSKLR